MIFIREAKENDKNRISDFIKYNHLNERILDHYEKHVFFLVLDRDQILGFSKYEFLSDETISENKTVSYKEASIKCIFIEKSFRRQSLGDGLLRGTLNHMRGVQVQRFLVDIDSEYVIEEDSIQAFLKWEDIKMNQVIDVEAFFSRQCRGGK